MKTQISRDGFRADKHYSGVYQQQGRMIIDRDWNELVDILKYHVDGALYDVIGAGSPKASSFTIQMAGGTPRIVPGRVYAGGLVGVVEPAPNADWPFGLNQQKGFPSAPPLPPAGTAYRIYADLWERPVLSLEDKDLRDPALHGADTCARTQVMAQIKTCAVALDPQSLPTGGNGLLTLRYAAAGGQLGSDPCDPTVAEVDPVGGDFLFRVEVHDVRWPAGGDLDLPERVVVKWSRENGAEQYEFKDVPDWFSAGPWLYEIYTVESEQHLGYHVPVLGNQSWSPKRGTLVTGLPQTAPEGTLVRRWDGYLVFVQSGGVWSVSQANGETPDVTAPGATVTFETVRHGPELYRNAARIGLSDLDFLLEIEGAIFVPGDYWSAPVRRAFYQAGGELLKEAWPSGIYHRYVSLAEVQANGQLRAPTPAEQRRMAFPRLTELDAGDMGYTTTCGSGLFNAGHDTVKKALDRLCEIAAQHVSYTKPQGGDTSIFRGNNPLTVRQALDLLADVKADDIGYTNSKDSSIDNVHEALDVLFNRQAGGGNRYTVGDGGDFGSIPDAISALQDESSVALALMPGKHDLENFDFADLIPGARLSIHGLGLASRINVQGHIGFRGLSMLELESVAMHFDRGGARVSECLEVVIKDSWLDNANAFSTSQTLLEVEPGSVACRVLISNCLLDTQPASQDPHVANVLRDFNEDIPNLFAVGYGTFRTRVRNLAAPFASLPLAQRQAFAQALRSRTPGTPAPLPGNEHAAYAAMATAIEAASFRPNDLVDAFERLRLAIAGNDAGTALVFHQGRATILLEGNAIRGRIGLYGLPGTGDIDSSTVWNRQKAGVYNFGRGGGDLHLRNNHVMGIRVAQSIADWLHQNGTSATFPDPIQNLVLTDNRIDGVFNVFARRVQVNSTHFTSPNSVGWILSDLGFYIGSHGETTLTGFTDMARTASNVGNLRLNISRLP